MVVGEVVDRVDRLAAERRDGVALGQAGLLGRTVGDHAGDRGATGAGRIRPDRCSRCSRRVRRSRRTDPAGRPDPVLELPAGLTSTPRKAVVPMCTVEEALPATIWRAMESAVLIGMAKPWVPDDWSLDWNENPAEAAVSMPST